MLLALGMLTPLGAALVASVMLVAVLTVHVKNGFFVTAGGYEYNLVLGVAALTVAFTGPGSLSIDALRHDSLGGTAWGIGAAIVAVPVRSANSRIGEPTYLKPHRLEPTKGDRHGTAT